MDIAAQLHRLLLVVISSTMKSVGSVFRFPDTFASDDFKKKHPIGMFAALAVIVTLCYLFQHANRISSF
jgi:hypothetical protein